MNEAALAEIMLHVHQKAIQDMQRLDAIKTEMDSIMLRQQAIQRLLEIKP